MIKMFRNSVIGFAALVLSACAGQVLEDTQGLQPMGDAFTQALYFEYLDRAEHEYGYGNFESADDFSKRAQASAQGNAPLPSFPDDYALPGEHVGEIKQSYRRLNDALAGGGPEKAPKDMARAQVMFDCWVEEQAEGRQPTHIAHCRNEFMAAMDRVEAILNPPKKMVKKPAPPRPTQQDFIIYFDFDIAKLTAEAKDVVAKAIKFANSTKSSVVVHGHADRAGSEKYNQGLSERRSESAILEMLENNVKANTVKAASFGETDPAVPTKDGVRHPKNRRVEISVIPVN
jgi:outer membrane protein OmpA-like peptidoglycan-associated protein